MKKTQKYIIASITVAAVLVLLAILVIPIGTTTPKDGTGDAQLAGTAPAGEDIASSEHSAGDASASSTTGSREDGADALASGSSDSQPPGTSGETPESQGQPQDPPAAKWPLDYRQDEGGVLELPVSGATGWAARPLPMRTFPEAGAEVVANLVPGRGFVVLQEDGDWWNVRLSGGAEGWVEHKGCFINLPDVIPSIVYNNTNSVASLKQSSGFEIPGITGQALYDAWAPNQRFGREEYVVPALYATSARIAEVQAAALANGETLVIYEVFRPRQTQLLVANNLTYLVYTNEVVFDSINTPPWTLGAFIATTLSNHQRGAAMDVSLARVIAQEVWVTGDYAYVHITGYEEYAMPSQMHELSPMAAAYRIQAGSAADRLRSYCTDVGFGTVSSEWWHFDDRAGITIASANGIYGEFFIGTIHSAVPYSDFDDNTFIFSTGLPQIEALEVPEHEDSDEGDGEEDGEGADSESGGDNGEGAGSESGGADGEGSGSESGGADGEGPGGESGGDDGEGPGGEAGEKPEGEQYVLSLIEEMSLQDQVSQLLILCLDEDAWGSPEDLTSDLNSPGAGGYLLYTDYSADAEIFEALIDALSQISQLPPFICLEDIERGFLESGSLLLSGITPDGLQETFGELISSGAYIIVNGFEGIAIADLAGETGTGEGYFVAEAAVAAIEAGADMLLVHDGFDEVLAALVNAVESGAIQAERIQDSLTKVLMAKFATLLIAP